MKEASAAVNVEILLSTTVFCSKWEVRTFGARLLVLSRVRYDENDHTLRIIGRRNTCGIAELKLHGGLGWQPGHLFLF
jgi:hypothetical protein